MQKTNSGFTWMELIIVVVVLGVLAAFAIPKYLELTADTRKADINEIAKKIASGNSINYAARKSNSEKGVAITNCTDAVKTLSEELSHDYQIISKTVPADESVECTITGPGSVKATFTVTGVK